MQRESKLVDEFNSYLESHLELVYNTDWRLRVGGGPSLTVHDKLTTPALPAGYQHVPI